MPDDVAKQTVIDAFEQGAQLGALDKRFVKLTELAMRNVGLELARNVRAGERAAVCVPVQVDNGTKVNPGAALLLEHRVVLAWIEGILKPKPYSVSSLLADVSDVHAFARKVGLISAQLDAISFSANGRKIEIVLHSEVAHKRVAFTNRRHTRREHRSQLGRLTANGALAPSSPLASQSAGTPSATDYQPQEITFSA
jgi:hypothetical protein